MYGQLQGGHVFFHYLCYVSPHVHWVQLLPVPALSGQGPPVTLFSTPLSEQISTVAQRAQSTALRATVENTLYSLRRTVHYVKAAERKTNGHYLKEIQNEIAMTSIKRNIQNIHTLHKVNEFIYCINAYIY